MSLIIATACESGLIIGSDSRAIVGDAARQDFAPKVEIVSPGLAVALTGEVRSADFDVTDAPAAYWTSVDYRLTPRTFEGFVEELQARIARTPPRQYADDAAGISQGVGVLVCGTTADERIIAGARLPFHGAPAARFARYTAASIACLVSLGRPVELPALSMRTGALAAGTAMTLVLEGLTAAARTDRDVGGVLGLFLLPLATTGARACVMR